MRKHLVTFDLWDFSGHPDFTSVYSCFNCHNSLHIVFNIAEETDEIIRWLSDIQSLSPLHRVPVILVFTHMDKFETREEKEKDREIPKIKGHQMLAQYFPLVLPFNNLEEERIAYKSL